MQKIIPLALKKIDNLLPVAKPNNEKKKQQMQLHMSACQ